MDYFAVEKVSKYYGKKCILADINLTINSGVAVAIVGANGCGKSTLLSMLAGVNKLSSGTIYLKGSPLKPNDNAFFSKIGYIPQENPLFYNYTVYDNLRFWYANSKRNLSDDLETGILADFNLAEYKNYPVYKLSGGMQKRLSIAVTLSKEPEILILDEPLSSLDIVCKHDICKYINAFKKNGGTVIFTSHEELDLSTADYMYLIHNKGISKLDKVLTGEALFNCILGGKINA